MKASIALLTAAALLAPAASFAQVATITDKPGIVGSDGKMTRAKDGRLCKTMVITGSRLPTKKVCKTQEEWDLQAAASKDELDELMRRNGSNNRIENASGG
ncbi:MAG: hypothetical protein KF842_03150 [Caulobacter sp.]|nr:hypothetical protein [Caulobacter sp.]